MLTRRDVVRVTVLFVAFFAAVLVAGNAAFAWLPSHDPGHRWPDHPVIETLARWDTGWYFHIAEDGYFYDGPGRQAAVAFFPAYPAIVRVVAFALRDTIVSGVVVTLLSALAASVVFVHWASARLGRTAATTALLLLYAYPFSYFLFGAVYSDALFLLAAIGAFALLERDQPVLAGLVGAVATAGRPVGLAVVVGLVAVAVQRRGGWRAVRWRDAGVLVAGMGFAAYMAYLAWRFGEPFAFSKVQTAEGWNRQINLEMIAKVDFYRRWRDFGWTLVNVVLALQALLSLIALALVPRVARRFGWGYAVYVVAVLGLPLATSSDFLAMGRYLLPAFPVFAAGGELLERLRLPARALVLGTSSLVMLWLTTLFARWYLLS